MRKLALLSVVLLFVGIASANSLTVDFYWEPVQPTDLEEVHFYDNSTGDIIAWIWYFGDGSSSTEQNPVHKYEDNGTYLVRLVVWDKYGQMEYKEKYITILNVPPVANAGEDRIVNNLTVTFNASLSYDLDGYIEKYIWNFGDGNSKEGKIVKHEYEEEGIYNVNLTVIDNDGAKDYDEINVTVDVTPPITNYSLNEEKEWYNTSVIVTLNATDNLAGINKTYYKIDDGDWQEYTKPFNFSAEGTHKIYYYSIDNAGNAEEVKNFTIKIDYTPPVTNYSINATYGNNGWIVSKAKITLNATDNLAGINKTYYKIDDGDWQEYTKPFNFSAEGTHKIYYYSIDNAGNAEEVKNFTIKIDTKAPTAKLNEPQEGYIYIAGRKLMPTLFGNTFIIGKFTAEADASDDTSGIDYVEFILNGQILWKDYVAPYSVALPQEFPFSLNKLKVVAYDKAGNKVETEEISYIKIL